MGRRARSNSTASTHILQNNSRNVHLNQLRALTNHSPHPTAGGMTPGSRYSHNLKVLRRRDPSIVSIFDQFSHVCLYHHNGEKWEKKGYEGSMFLYERDAYPPYGFYILNRMGMDDYIQRMYPEDDMNILGDYLMYKCYPDYTGLRLGLPMDNHRGIDPDLKNDKHKGRSITVGLWMFATESREPMKDVMMRLHDYIRRNQLYPDEYRYGPDRPPPPNPHLRISSDSSPEHDVRDIKATTQSSNTPELHELFSTSSNGMTEIDKLFAKFAPSPSTSQPSKPTPQTSVDSLFASALANGGPSQCPSPGPRASSTVSNRGLALLDSIFASATPVVNNHPPPQPLSVPTSSVQILSPKPTSTALPQVHVISTLLGLAPSPGGSVSSSSTNMTGYRYEGDNESTSEEGGFSEGELSASGTVLDEELELEAQAGVRRNPAPSFSLTNLAADFSQNLTSPGVQGDVTPRPTLKGMRTSTPPADSSPSHRKREQPRQLLHPIRRLINTGSDVAQDRLPESSTSRSLVPFEPDSELWPHPRAPLDDRSLDTDGEVVELDFSDISALSDPNLFRGKRNANVEMERKKKDKKDKEREREDIGRGRDNLVTGACTTRPSTAGNNAPQRPTPFKGGGKPATEDGTELPANGNRLVKKNGTSVTAQKQTTNGLDRGMVKDALLATASASFNHKGIINTGGMDRNEFVREVLMLIHTDKSFVDNLWTDYLARTG